MSDPSNIAFRSFFLNNMENKNGQMVFICRESIEAMMLHALTTEKEEVMGLLFGEIANQQAYVYQIYILARSDKRKDRVEVSHDQLTKASGVAEQVGFQGFN